MRRKTARFRPFLSGLDRLRSPRCAALHEFNGGTHLGVTTHVHPHQWTTGGSDDGTAFLFGQSAKAWVSVA